MYFYFIFQTVTKYGKLNEDSEMTAQLVETDSYANQYWTLLAVTVDRITFIVVMLCITAILML